MTSVFQVDKDMADAPSLFDEVIDPIGRDHFLATYWGKSFVHIKGRSDRFRDLFGWDDLNRILETHQIFPPRLQLYQDSLAIDPAAFMLPSGLRPDPGKMAARLSEGATLVMLGIKELAPPVEKLMRSFQDVLEARNFVNLYAAWGRKKGFDLHWDAHDSIMIQLSGRKRWTIHAPTRDYVLEQDIERPVAPSGAPLWEGSLETGDALYVPRGWWHGALALDEPSLHLTLSSTPPTVIDLLHHIVDGMRTHRVARADLPFSKDRQRQRNILSEVRSLLLQALDDQAISRYRSCPTGNGSAKLDFNLPLSPYNQSEPINAETMIRLASVQRLEFSPLSADELVTSSASGMTWHCPVKLVPAMQLLSDVAPRSFAELAAALPEPAMADDLAIYLNGMAAAGIILLNA